jgi:hypothetical protein
LVTGQIMHLSHNYAQAPEPVQQPAAKCTVGSIITDQDCPPPPPPPFRQCLQVLPLFLGSAWRNWWGQSASWPGLQVLRPI